MSNRWSHSDSNTAEWRKQRARVLARDGHACQLKLDGCTLKATQVDHVAPWAPGKIAPDHQLQASCGPCNKRAGSPERRNPPVGRPAWLAE